MLELETRSLGAKERAALASSLGSTLSQRGMRNLVLFTFVVFTAVVVFSIFGIERIPLTAIGLLVVAVLVAEKIACFRELRVYKSLVRTLALRLEQMQPRADEPAPATRRTGSRPERRVHPAEDRQSSK